MNTKRLVLTVIVLAAGSGCSNSPPTPPPPPPIVPGLTLSLVSPPTFSNCGSLAKQGAGITSMTITLEHTGNVCAPVVFTRKHGNVVVQQYTVNCSAPSVTSCIETDEVLTTSPTDPETYILHVRAKIGAVDCWTSDSSLDARLGASVMHTVGLTPTKSAGCPISSK